MNNQQQDENDIKQKDLEKMQHIEKQSTPLCLTKAFVEKPCLVIAICSFIYILCTILSIALNLFEQSEGSSREWSGMLSFLLKMFFKNILQKRYPPQVWSNQKTIDYDIYNAAIEEYKKNSEEDSVAERSEVIDAWSTIIMLECYENDEEQCDNALESKFVTALYELEKQVKAHPDYKTVCLATLDSTECADQGLVSFTNLFSDAELSDNTISEEELQSKLDLVLNDEDTYLSNAYLFGKEFKVGNKKTRYLRSIFKFGAPLKVNGKLYKNRYDDEDKQKDQIVDFSEEMIDLVEKMADSLDGKISILIFSGPVADILFAKMLDGDFLWALASIVFVWAYLTFHLKSFFLSSFSILGILMTFTITSVIFKLILQISYFSTLHVLVIFIVLGIAADDIFVFIDAWKQTEFYDILGGDFNKRMAVTFKRASKAMLATSSTTSAAFLATGFSSIMPISSFGIYAAILIPMNYIMVITFFPALLIIYENKLKNKCCTGKKVQESQKEGHTEKISNMHDDLAGQPASAVPSNQQQKTQPQKQITRVESFFENRFNSFVFKARYPIIAIFLIWFGIATWLALQLGPQTKPDQWLPDDYELQRSIVHIQEDFIQAGESEIAIFVQILWGLKGMNTEDNAVWDPEDSGELIWDKEFDLSPEDNQQAIANLCTDLKSNENVRDGKVTCFMLDFKDWLDINEEDFPVPSAQFNDKLKEFAENTDKGYEHLLSNKLGFFKGKLNFVSIEVVSVGDPLANYTKKEPIEQEWEKIESNFNKSAPKGVNNAIQLSESWVWMVSQRAFVDQAINGMLVSLAFALLVLLISTHNVIVSLYSVFCITGIVVSVVTVMYLSGWELGIAESITIVILIGFSVDYVVHLANHYVESSYDDKFRRMQEALKEIGISIISGAITTLGSGVFLFFAIISIFNKFAVLIVATIMFSLLFSLLFFAALMHAIGPQKQQGNILELCKKKNRGVVQSNYQRKDLENQQSQKTKLPPIHNKQIEIQEEAKPKE